MYHRSPLVEVMVPLEWMKVTVGFGVVLEMMQTGTHASFGCALWNAVVSSEASGVVPPVSVGAKSVVAASTVMVATTLAEALAPMAPPLVM